MKQKEVFLKGEADRWFERNANCSIRTEDRKILNYLKKTSPQRVLEIGCGTGTRLKYFSNELPKCLFFGVDPAEKAAEVDDASYTVKVATADNLPFNDDQFDTVIVGFCLYLCDAEDYFKIAAEVDRVLRDTGVLVVIDFEPPFGYQNAYVHKEGLWSTKMSFREMFCWHPSYTLSEMFSYSHDTDSFHPDPDERVSLSIMHKLHHVNLPRNPYNKIK